VTYAGWELDPGKIFSGAHNAVWQPGSKMGILDPQISSEINVASPQREWISLSHNGMSDVQASKGGRLECGICFQGRKDVVIPFKPGIIDIPKCEALRARSIWTHDIPREGEGRDTVFFFAGSHPLPKPGKQPSVRGLRLYAHPHVRADIHRLHKQTPNFKVVNSLLDEKVDPVTWMLKSQFCWVPPGQRYGDPRRHLLSASFGCIPVFTLPNGHFAFDELLPWKSMAVMVNRSDLPNLPAILAKYSAADRERMRTQLRCAWPRLWFSSIYGSCFGDNPRFDAFDALMATLRYRIKDPAIVKPAYASSTDACAQTDRPLRL